MFVVASDCTQTKDPAPAKEIAVSICVNADVFRLPKRFNGQPPVKSALHVCFIVAGRGDRVSGEFVAFSMGDKQIKLGQFCNSH